MAGENLAGPALRAALGDVGFILYFRHASSASPRTTSPRPISATAQPSAISGRKPKGEAVIIQPLGPAASAATPPS
jgi:hypothetical protein